jgi:hypothetical protein
MPLPPPTTTATLRLKLRFLQRPVLDPECLEPRQPDVVVKRLELLRLLGAPDLRQRPRRAFSFQRSRALHHMDGVDEELRRDARFALVLAEAEQAKTGNHDDRGIAVAQRRRRRLCECLVIRCVVCTVLHDALVDAEAKRRDIFLCGIPGDEHRRDARAEEMIRTARPQFAELLRPCRIGECD